MVDWVYTNVVGLRRRKDAVEICQQLMDTVHTRLLLLLTVDHST